MHIAFITQEYSGIGQLNGGLGNYLTRLTTYLQATGHTCEVFIFNPLDFPDGPDEVLYYKEVRINRLATQHPSVAFFETLPLIEWVIPILKGAWRIAEAIKKRHGEDPFDVIQATNVSIPGLFIDIPAPTILRFSSYERLWSTAYSAPQNMSAAYLQILERQCIRDSDNTFAPSKFLSDTINKELGIKIPVIPTPAYLEVPPSDWDTSWVNCVTHHGKPYFVFVGSLSTMKGTDIIVDALPKVLQTHPDLHMHFVGRNLLPDCSAFYRFINKFKGRIHYHESQPHQRIYPLVARAEVLLAPSLVENLPNVVIEASLLKTPTIGTKGTSINEIIQDGETGLLIPPNDYESLTEAMLQFLSIQEDKRCGMRQKAAKFAKNTYNPSKTISALLELYEQVIKQPQTTKLPREQRYKIIKADLNALENGYQFLGTIEEDLATAKSKLFRIHNHIIFGPLLRFWKKYINHSLPYLL